MTKVYFKERVIHSVEWLRAIHFILQNRGRETYGAQELRNLIRKYVMDYSADPVQQNNAEKSLQEIENLLHMKKVKNLKRFGAANDGGYIGIETKETPILLSGGAGKNIDFEIELAQKGIKVHLYDPTIKRLPKEHANIFHFCRALSVPGNQKFKSFSTLAQAISTLNSDENKPLWLKIDIEGSEIELLSYDLNTLPKFQQIFVEFHDTYQIIDPIYRDRFMSILRKLDENFNLISIVSNNWKGITNYGCSFLPETFEATFISKRVQVELCEEYEYNRLRNANNPRRPSIPDNPFRVSNFGNS